MLAIDSQETSNAGHNSTTSPLTWTFNNTAGNKLYVPVTASSNSATAPTIGTVSYNGVSMTLVTGSSQTISASNATISAIYYLDSPATGSHAVSVAVTFPGGTTVTDIIAGAISFSGAASGSNTAVSSQGNSTGPATTSLSTTSGQYVLSLAATGTGLSSTPTNPTTLSWLDNVSGNSSGDNAGMGTQTTSGGTVSATWGLTASDFWIITAVAVS
jgi:hypothetical protein